LTCSETHNLKKETIKQQIQWVRSTTFEFPTFSSQLYESLIQSFLAQVKERTSNFNNYNAGSHVMEYGNKSIKAEKLYIYQGFDPATVNFPPNGGMRMEVVNQRDAELFFLWQLVSF